MNASDSPPFSAVSAPPPVSPIPWHLNPLVDRIRAAIADKTPLRIRGGGSKDFYGHALQGEVLETTALTGIVAYEPSELVVTVQAGTPLAALDAALAQIGVLLGHSAGQSEASPPAESKTQEPPAPESGTP